MKGKLGRYFALGSTSGKRGYYFAYPIIYAAENLGVIVVKMDLSNIELNWSNRKVQFVVSDLEGVTFITTQPEWLYHSIKPLSTTTLKQIHISQRYDGIDIKNLNTNTINVISDNSSIIRINDNKKRKSNNEYFTLQKNMSHACWNVMILAPLNELRKNGLIVTIVLSLISLLVNVN
ncbi:MAG: hypothetical protein KZQ57_12855 [gamma proteobacterium symbiont of Lucinoma myriamae]|nr:hypothetical protein [gamma proteobacterium symbiont of Lucinoma myriamae]